MTLSQKEFHYVNVPFSEAIETAYKFSVDQRHTLAELELRNGSDSVHEQIEGWSTSDSAAAMEHGLFTYGTSPQRYQLSQLGIETVSLLRWRCRGICCERDLKTNDLDEAHLSKGLRDIGNGTHWQNWSAYLGAQFTLTELNLLRIEHIIDADWHLTLYGYRLIQHVAAHREG